MKKILFACLLPLAACAVTDKENTEKLVPLPTTGITNYNTTSTIPYISNEEYSNIMKNLKDKDFINEVENWYGNSYIPMTTQTIIEFGHLWCEVLQAGMTPFDVQSRIDEGAVNQDDASLHEAIVKAAVFHYCPDQQYKWEP